jgi:hypothetical protein
LDVVDTSDNVSSYPTVNAQAMGVLDQAVTITEGTLASRPAASAVAYGTHYYATDNSTYYVSNATAWATVLTAGAWSSLTLGSGVGAAAGDYTPTARIEGDLVRLRGAIQNTSGSTIAVNTTIITVPSAGMHPASTPFLNLTLSGGGSGLATVGVMGTSGALQLSSAGPTWPNAYVIGLNGLSYSIS